ncbi:PPE family protein [Mycobacterium decipiens]|uniref:PPE family protein n=1 Tax=Mycobacterium decipiens TaxID=1430326 RepID=A0A1X2LSI6_9MYCO|nr:PPE family protein [Mycobacterium decipiens]OSC39688.1 hypothetical protein B8W66_16160 [Mycobacterium decipiens]
MTTALDFATLPPEINSGRMYFGPGSASILAAASAWNELAAELHATALSYGSVLSALTGEEWYGPASAAMAAAAAPYVVWMGATAIQAEQTGAQAEAAAASYEAALAATVPPPVIEANRAQLAVLTASNVLGQNATAIAATEAEYAEMWAQDADAMYGYAASSAAATQLTAFAEPAQTTNPTGLAAQSAAVAQATGQAAGNQPSTLSQLLTAIPNVLQGLSSSGSFIPSWLQQLWANWGPNANVWNTLASTGLFLPSTLVDPFVGILGAVVAAHAAGDVLDAGASGTASEMAAPLGSTGGVSAGAANASIVGKLSVPPSWTETAPPASPLGSALGGTPMVAPPPAGAAGMPGMPIGAMAGQGFGRAMPQYGFRPRFVARPPAAG